jgi:two-component system chemotaxis response regulator CheB
MAADIGRQAVAVVLTGMGEDGARGLGDVAAAGGPTLAQDEGTSVVYGMSRAAAEHGAQIISSPREIGIALTALTFRGPR